MCNLLAMFLHRVTDNVCVCVCVCIIPFGVIYIYIYIYIKYIMTIVNDPHAIIREVLYVNFSMTTEEETWNNVCVLPLASVSERPCRCLQ